MRGSCLSVADSYRIYSIVHPSLFCWYFLWYIFVLRSLLFLPDASSSLFFFSLSYGHTRCHGNSFRTFVWSSSFCLMPVAYNLYRILLFLINTYIIELEQLYRLDGHLPLSFHPAFSGDIPNWFPQSSIRLSHTGEKEAREMISFISRFYLYFPPFFFFDNNNR